MQVGEYQNMTECDGLKQKTEYCTKIEKRKREREIGGMIYIRKRFRLL